MKRPWGRESMDCTWITRDDIFEGYVRDALGPNDRDAFEEHYFGCNACVDKLRTYQALRFELPQSAVAPEVPSRLWSWKWSLAPAAALLLLAVAVVLWQRPDAVPGTRRGETLASAQGDRAAPSAPRAVVQGGEQATPQLPPTPASAPAVALSVLARVEAPVYIPASLRGPRDEAAETFQSAMRRYTEGDYAGAIPGLRAASTLKPDVPQYTFFLAICQLLAGQVQLSVAGLRQTIAFGDSPYIEEAHFYLAKARLQQGDVPAARVELQRTIQRRGRLAEPARTLLAQVDALSDRRDGPREK